MNLAATILNVVLAVAFLGTGAIKLIGNKTSMEMRDHIDVGAQLWRLIGALEVAGASDCSQAWRCQPWASPLRPDWASVIVIRLAW